MAENEASQLLVGGTDVVERNGRIGDVGCVGRSVADMHLQFKQCDLGCYWR